MRRTTLVFLPAAFRRIKFTLESVEDMIPVRLGVGSYRVSANKRPSKLYVDRI